MLNVTNIFFGSNKPPENNKKEKANIEKIEIVLQNPTIEETQSVEQLTSLTEPVEQRRGRDPLVELENGYYFSRIVNKAQQHKVPSNSNGQYGPFGTDENV